MKPLLYLFLLLTFTACNKEKPKPITSQMHYTNLGDAQVGYRTGKNFDLDGNGTIDISFRVYAVGDPLLQMDKYQYCAVSMIESNFPINKDDNIDVRKSGDLIKTNNTSDYEWFQVSLALLAQKNIGIVDPPYWTGLWKDVQHQFLPIQIVKKDQRYNGWVELSFDKTAEKIIVHRSGVSTVPEVDVKAGY